jgi:hypothetical protein
MPISGRPSAFLVAEVTGQRAGQDVDLVGQPVRAWPVIVGPAGRWGGRWGGSGGGSGGRGGGGADSLREGRVDGGEQRIDAFVLFLHRVQHRQGMLAVDQARAQGRPDELVLGGVVDTQLALEQLPAGRDRPAPGRVGKVRRGGCAGQPGQVTAERVVCREHDGQVGVAGAVPGGVGAWQFLRGHRISSPQTEHKRSANAGSDP